jgi:mono/diheme cytochrome c family protein
MAFRSKAYARITIGAGLAIVAALGWRAVPVTAAGDVMPAAQQNALVKQYCAICHTDTSMNGGLSLEHFDAGHADPGLAAMMVSKLKTGALGAGGGKLPDRAIQDALQNALTLESVGAGKWYFNQTQDAATQAPLLIASVVQEAASKAKGQPDLYWLTLTCREDNHETAMQLAWSPGVPENGRSLSVALDGKPPVTYRVEGAETMGNGQVGTSGPGSIMLYENKEDSRTGKLTPALPEKTLTVSNVFGDEKVEFPFNELNQNARQSLSACMGEKR